MKGKLIEQLAALEHDQWIAWSQTIARTENISQERIDRWKKCWVPYAELTEEMKEYDRIWARHIPEILSRHEAEQGEGLRERLEEYLFMLDKSGFDSDKEYAKEIRRRCLVPTTPHQAHGAVGGGHRQGAV